MKVQFSTRRFEATEKLQQFTEKEVMHLKRYFDGDIRAEIILEDNNGLKTVDLRINALSKVFPTRIEGDDFYKIIPKAVDKVEKQLKSAKDKLQNN